MGQVQTVAQKKMMLGIRLSTNDGRFQNFRTANHSIVLGRGASCTLRIPLPWFSDKVLEIQNSPEVIRVRSLWPEASITAMGQIVGEDWHLLPERANLQLVSGSHLMKIELQSARSLGPSVLVKVNSNGVSQSGFSGATIMTADGKLLQEEIPVAPAREQVVAPNPRKLTGLHVANWVAVFSVLFAIMGLLGYYCYKETQKRAAGSARVKQFNALVDRGNDYLEKGAFPEAKSAFIEAERIARADGSTAEIDEIRELFQRPEIQYGSAGLRPLNGQWVTPAVITAWQAAEQKHGEALRALQTKITEEIAASKFEDAKIHCAEAIALMDQFPEEGKPHPNLATFKDLAQEIAAKNESSASTRSHQPPP